MVDQKKLHIVLFVVSSVGVMMFAVLVVGVLVLYSMNENVDEPFFDVKKYQLVTMTHETKSVSFGYVSGDAYGGKFHKGEMFQGRNGDYILISELGSKEYRCSGTCTCGDYSRRMVGARILSSGLFYLAAGVSGVIVHKRAADYFRSECQDLYSDSCPIESIFAEVDDCERIGMLHHGHDHDHSDMDKIYHDLQHDLEHLREHHHHSHEDEEFQGFECDGKCVRHQDAPTEGNYVVCGMYEMKGLRVDVPKTDFTSNTGYVHVAEAKFAKTSLSEFCERVKHPEDGESSTIIHCMSMLMGQNPSIKCVEKN